MRDEQVVTADGDGGTIVSDDASRFLVLEREWRELANFTNEFRRNSRHSLTPALHRTQCGASVRGIRIEDRHLLCNHYL